MIKYTKIFLLPLLILFYSCGENPFESQPVDVIERGEIVKILSENDVSQSELNLLFNEFDIPGGIEINLRNGIKVISAIYRTIDYNGNPADASGLFVIPKTQADFPLISLHHGTQSKRNNVGSQSSIYSLDALIAGALGYVALSPDMLGLGISTLVHPYHVADVNANTSIDFIRAVKKYASQNNIQLNGQLFLAGYSQGGYTTMAVHKKMQNDLSSEFTITASAPMAGAHDLVGTARYIISNNNYERPSFLAFMIYSYSQIYNLGDLSQFFQQPYQNLIPTLFNGSLTTEEIDGALPKTLSQLFNESFLNSMRDGSEQVMTNLLQQNSLLDWAPQSPVLIVHGNADTYVPYQNAITAKESWEANGAPNVELVTINGGTHTSSIIPAILTAISWFEGFRIEMGNYIFASK